MKFIVDAQLPKRLTQLFLKTGFSCSHTSDLPFGNLTSDSEIRRLSMLSNLIVITKDTDFFHSYLLRKEPYKLVFVAVGNLKLSDLITHFESLLPNIIDAIRTNGMIEINLQGVKVITN
jgi:predicted nuclease of predicted toxin-antitoxin system